MRRAGVVGAMLLVAAVDTAPGQGGDSAEPQVRLQAPRDFGYLTGDLVELHASLRVPSGFTLRDDPGRPDAAWPAWLEVRETSWKAREAPDAVYYDLRSLFQVFYVADSVTTLEIPARAIVFRSETGEELRASLPPFRFSLSPLTDSGGTLEPDLAIAPPSPRLIWLAAVTLAALCLWAVLSRAGYRRRGRVFRRARRDLRRARDCGEALLRLHRALEERAGRAVFAHDLGPLTDRWPAVEAVRGDLDRFFGLSDAVFFGNGGQASEDCLPWLRGLADRLATLERRDGGGGGGGSRDKDRNEPAVSP